MTLIVAASEEDIKLLSEIGELSFMESHGTSASQEEIKSFVARYCSEDAFKQEFYGLKLGKELLKFLIKLSKAKDQKGFRKHLPGIALLLYPNGQHLMNTDIIIISPLTAISLHLRSGNG